MSIAERDIFDAASAADGELMSRVAWSDPDSPTMEDGQAYEELISRGFTPNFIAQTCESIRVERRF